jgi:hypothetical protein
MEPWKMNTKETGVVVLTIGASVFGLGFVLLMDRALMIAGNLLVIAGLVILARSRMLGLLRPERLQGTAVFALGVLFLWYNFVLFGFLMELVGLFLILKDSLPTFRDVLKKLLFGKLLSLSR